MIRGRRTRINYAKDWEYTTNDTATLVTKYIGNKTDVVIPNKIEGKPVVLQNSGDYEMSCLFGEVSEPIENVSIQKGVVFDNNDASYAFFGCDALLSVSGLPESTKNVSHAFDWCGNLVNAPIIPNGVTNIECTFEGCNSLVNAPVIPNGVTSMRYTFCDCSNLVNTPAIPVNVTDMIGTFRSCTNLVNAPVIPANVTNMGWTFAGCHNLVNAPVIPENVTYMGGTFRDCVSLTGNIIIKSNRINNTSMQYSFNGTTLPKNVYIPATGLDATNNTWNAAFNTTYGINGKNGVTVIDDAALDWTYTTNDTATLLTKYTGTKADVAVPATLAAKPTMLSTAVFKGTNVNSVDLGGVNFAGNNMANTFNNCTNLKGVTNLVNTVTEANDAFHGCTNLKSVGTYNDARVQFSNGVNLFRNCRNLISAPNHSFKNATATGIFNISHAFENCANLTTANSGIMAYIYYMKTDSNVKPVDASYMFANCVNLTSISEDSPVTRSTGWNSNYSHMFYNCRSLTNTSHTFRVIYAGWNSNCSNMYAQCAGLKSSWTAFVGPNDDTVNINIDDMYAGCGDLTDVAIDLPRTTRMAGTFRGCSNLVDAPTIPSNVTDMYRTFAYCENLVNAPTIPENVTNMFETFAECIYLVNAPDIPANVINMRMTFYGCSHLINAPVIPPNVANMAHTFYGCKNLKGDVMIFSNKINSAGFNSTFFGTTKQKNVYMYNTGYNATANSWNAAHNISISFNGHNGVNVINMGTWENASWTYLPSGTNTLVTKYKGTNNTVYVPSKINGRNVVLNSPNTMSGVFMNNQNITKVKFGNNIKFTNNSMIGAFRWCSNLVEVSNLPESVTGLYATFDGCINLVNAPVIPANVTDMGRTFHDCTNLVNAPIIPANVTNMYMTFSSCSNLVNAPTIPANVTDMQSAFDSCSNLVNAPIIPANVIDLGSVFRDCIKLSNVPNMTQAISVKNMGSTFRNCTNLVNAPAMPDNATNMSQTFIYCNNLVNAPIIPANVINMCGTFWNCTNLTGNIKIMSNRIINTAIVNCFMNTSKTKNVYIPFTGYTHNAAINSRYGINGKNGVTIYDINTYKG